MKTLEELLALVARLDELSDDEVTELKSDLKAYGKKITGEDVTVTDAVVQEMNQVAEALDAVDAAETAREAAAQEREAAADALRERLRDEDPGDGDDGDDGDESDAEDDKAPAPSGDEVKEPVAAGGAPVVPARKLTAKRPKTTVPAAAARPTALVASANLPSINQGHDLSKLADLSDAFREAWRAGIGYKGGRVEVPVATARFEWPEERLLDDNVESNEAKIAAVTSRQAIIAAGGICAPSPIDYSLPVIGSASQPLRDGLPSFGATRGQIRTLVPPTIADVSGAITDWTHANDLEPASPTTKACLTVACGTDTTTAVDAIVQCLKFGNFRDRYFPEQIEAYTKLVSVWAARIAERKYITKIGAGSTAITAGSILGTTRSVLAALDRYAASTKDYYRLEDSDRFRLLAPRWLRDNMRADLAREMPGAAEERLSMADAYLTQLLTKDRPFNVTWLMDGETGQRFVLPVAGGLQPWPSTVNLYLFLEGSWIYLNGGNLNLGTVRDSTLNSTNDFQLFQEEFGQVHFHGTFSHRLNVDICPDGTTSGSTTLSICTTSS